jgi:serine/threonine protein phosphatase 1
MFPTQIDGPVAVIGDLHGSYEQLRALLEFLTAYRLHEGRFLVFLGDFVDIGPDTARTIDLLLAFQKQHSQTVCLAGNHDWNLAKALGLVGSPHQPYYAARITTRNAQTLASYGAATAAELAEKMPAAHKDFLADLPWAVEHPDFLFVHAGLDPSEPYGDQVKELRQRHTTTFKPKWLYSDRLAFCDPRPDTDKVVVSGHTILRQPYLGDRRILLDTGCGYGGALTACLLPERLLIQVPPSVGKKQSYQGTCRPALENEDVC